MSNDASADRKARVYVGTYAGEGNANGLTRLHKQDGSWSVGDTEADARNVSFATFSERRGLLYLVDEDDVGAITVLQSAPHGWKHVKRVSSGGALPCYIALDRDEKRLAVANYGSGHVALFDLDEAGLPLSGSRLWLQDGHGPVADRQDGPHPHCVCFDRGGERLYHVDLGADRIILYRPDEAAANPIIAFAAPPGSGPRHLVLHPRQDRALLVSELASTLTVLDIVGDTLEPRQTVSTVPAGVNGSLGGHLSLNASGDRAYVTNRGHDTIAVFACADDGTLDLLQHVDSGGASPRAFALLESDRELILANEQSETVTIFDIAEDGTLARRATLPLPGAAFPFVLPALPNS